MTRINLGPVLSVMVVLGFTPGCSNGSSSLSLDSQAPDTLSRDAGVPAEQGAAQDTGPMLDSGPKTDSPLPSGPCTFYVGTSGNDSNSGSSSRPWRTIQKAADTLQAGQTACVNPGVYSEGVTIMQGGSSTSSPVTIRGVGSSLPVVAPTNENGFTIKASFVQLENLEVKNGSPNNVSVEAKADDVRLKGLLVHHAAQEGILVSSAKRFQLSGGEVHDNGISAEEARAIGIRFNGIVDGTVVESAKLYQSSTTHSARGMSFFGTHGTKGITLRLLEIHDHQQHGIFLTPGNEYRDPTISDITVSRCWFHANGKRVRQPDPEEPGYYAANLLIQKAKEVRVERSLFNSSNGWGMDCFVCSNALIVNNIFVNIKKAASGIGPGAGVEVNAGQSNRVVHNTFVDLTKGLISTFRGYGTGPWPPPEGTLDWHNNVFYKNDDFFASSFETYTVGTQTFHYEQTDIHTNNLYDVDPKFVSYAKWDFQLQAGSPAIDTGGDQNVSEDYKGTKRPQGKAADKGAYERVP